MLLILRCFVIFIYSFLVCVFGIIYCFFSPRQPKHVATFSYLFGFILKILGLKVELRKSYESEKYNHAIYIANHQSYYDMLAVSNIVKPNVVTIGKRSLLWVPFFGLLFWLAGNFTVDRKNFKKANKTIRKILQIIKKKDFSLGFSRR